MKILSLNVRGLGGSTKQKSLHHLLTSVSPDLILLQGTMSSTYPALLAFSKLHLGWEFCAISSKGLSSGILLGWNPLRVRCKAFKTLQQKLDLASLFASFFVSRPSFSVFFFIFWTKWHNFTGWCYFRLFYVLFLNLAQIAV